MPSQTDSLRPLFLRNTQPAATAKSAKYKLLSEKMAVFALSPSFSSRNLYAQVPLVACALSLIQDNYRTECIRM